MKSRVQQAVEKKENGYNCAQAVFCTYADLLGFSETDAYKIAEAFGTGTGGMQQTCGAVTASSWQREFKIPTVVWAAKKHVPPLMQKSENCPKLLKN